MDEKEKAAKLLREIAALCREYHLSLSHEDEHGAFRVVPYREDLEVWLLEADCREVA